MIACSMLLMPTGSSLTLSVHAASHGAGQMRPVNSGKLLVESSTSNAFFQSFAIDQVVEVRNDVVDRAAAVAERRAAVHAARALHLGLVGPSARRRIPCSSSRAAATGRVACFQALVFHEAGDFSHAAAPPFCRLSWLLADGALLGRAHLDRLFAGRFAPWRSASSAVARGLSGLLDQLAERRHRLRGLISASARLYSFGNTLTNFARDSFQWSRISRARRLPVHL